MDFEAVRAQAAKLGFQRFSVGIIIPEGDRVLIVQRAADDFLGGFFELPGGGVDAGESVVEAIKRETKEETGLDVTGIKKYVGDMDYLSGSGKRVRQFTVVVNVRKTEPVILSAEHTRARWIRKEEVASAGMTPETTKLIEKYFGTSGQSRST